MTRPATRRRGPYLALALAALLAIELAVVLRTPPPPRSALPLAPIRVENARQVALAQLRAMLRDSFWYDPRHPCWGALVHADGTRESLAAVDVRCAPTSPLAAIVRMPLPAENPGDLGHHARVQVQDCGTQLDLNSPAADLPELFGRLLEELDAHWRARPGPNGQRVARSAGELRALGFARAGMPALELLGGARGAAAWFRALRERHGGRFDSVEPVFEALRDAFESATPGDRELAADAVAKLAGFVRAFGPADDALHAGTLVPAQRSALLLNAPAPLLAAWLRSIAYRIPGQPEPVALERHGTLLLRALARALQDGQTRHPVHDAKDLAQLLVRPFATADHEPLRALLSELSPLDREAIQLTANPFASPRSSGSDVAAGRVLDRTDLVSQLPGLCYAHTGRYALDIEARAPGEPPLRRREIVALTGSLVLANRAELERHRLWVGRDPRDELERELDPADPGVLLLDGGPQAPGITLCLATAERAPGAPVPGAGVALVDVSSGALPTGARAHGLGVELSPDVPLATRLVDVGPAGTLSLWLRPRHPLPARERYLELALPGGRSLRLVRHDELAACEASGPGGDARLVALVQSWTPGRWHHLWVDWGPRGLRLFVDGLPALPHSAPGERAEAPATVAPVRWDPPPPGPARLWLGRGSRGEHPARATIDAAWFAPVQLHSPRLSAFAPSRYAPRSEDAPAPIWALDLGAHLAAFPGPIELSAVLFDAEPFGFTWFNSALVLNARCYDCPIG